MEGAGRTGTELTLIRVACVGKKSTSPLARAQLKAVWTSLGRLAGIAARAMASDGAVMAVGVVGSCRVEGKCRHRCDEVIFDGLCFGPACPCQASNRQGLSEKEREEMRSESIFYTSVYVPHNPLL